MLCIVPSWKNIKSATGLAVIIVLFYTVCTYESQCVRLMWPDKHPSGTQLLSKRSAASVE